MTQSLVEQIDALLPQTQCTKCGFSGCKPYAQAICEGNADINQCPPGGIAGISKLAKLLGVEEKPLNQTFGTEQPRKTAFIIEQDCIGCTKCIPPVQLMPYWVPANRCTPSLLKNVLAVSYVLHHAQSIASL